MRLARTVAQGDLEPPTSLASRLALRNGCPSVTSFCDDMGLDFGCILQGDDEEIDRLADLAGAEPEPLRGAAVRPLSRQVFDTRAGVLTVRSLVRSRIRVCPACLAEGWAAQGTVPPRWLPWKLLSVRTCPHHARPLLTLPGAAFTMRGHDFARQVEIHKQRIHDAAQEEAHQAPSAFEALLVARLRTGPGPGWFDTLPLHVACRACDLLGLLLQQGPEAKFGPQGEGTLQAAAQAGFDVLRSGPAALIGALEALVPTFRGTQTSYAATFGAFYSWLASSPHDPQMAVIRELVRAFILDRFPVDEGTMFLGRPAPENRLFTIQTARTRLGLGAKRLSHLLLERGLAARDPVTGRAVPFGYLDRSLLEGIRDELAGVTLERDAADRLGLSVELFRKLVQEETIARRFDPAYRSHRYEIAHLERLLRAIRQEAGVVDALAPGQALLMKVAPMVKAPLVQLIRLAAEGRVRCQGWLEGHAGIGAAVVDVAQVRAALPLLADEGIGRNRLFQEMHVTYTTINALIERGLLAATPGRSAATRVTVPLVSRSSVEGFLAEYVPLGLLADEVGHPAAAYGIKLKAAGILPLPLPSGCSYIFRRADVAGFNPGRGPGSLRQFLPDRREPRARRTRRLPHAEALPAVTASYMANGMKRILAAAAAAPMGIRCRHEIRYVLLSAERYEALVRAGSRLEALPDDPQA